METTTSHFSSLDDGSNEIDEETIMKMIELRSEHAENLSNADSWLKISGELNISSDQCRKSVSQAISRYKTCYTSDESEVFQLIRRLEKNLEFQYCLDNFSEICRFCCSLTEDDQTKRTIYDDSTEATLNESNELIEKIHYTLYDNIIDNVDFKLSNLICGKCQQMVEEFYKFKKKCDRNAEVLSQVKNVLDKMMNNLEPGDASMNDSKACDALNYEDDELTREFDGSSGEEDIEEVEEENLEDLEPSDSNGNDVKIKLKKSMDSSKSEKKSYKGKNSQCPICGKLVKGIQMHMLIHTGERRHKCSYCCKSFTQSGQLKRHINSHLNIRNYKCPEPDCNRTFVDPSSVSKHLVVHNKEDRKFQCSLCGSRFNRLGALRYHEKTHRQERNHSCDICKKSFLAKYDLTKHYRTHTGEKPYSCKYCDKKFSISKNAKVHLRVHTKEKPYSCNFCDLSFAYRSSMKNHLVKIHNHADVSSLPLLQAINIALQNDSDQNEIASESSELVARHDSND